MVELVPVEAAVVRCFGVPDVLDAMPSMTDAFPCRVAPDEVLLLAAPSDQAQLLARVEAYFAADPAALVIQQPDGWSIWTIEGPGIARAWARLTSIELPETRPAFLQGEVAGVPAKALVLTGAIHIMVASSLGHHLRDRVLTACADLAPIEGTRRPLIVGSAATDEPS